MLAGTPAQRGGARGSQTLPLTSREQRGPKRSAKKALLRYGTPPFEPGKLTFVYLLNRLSCGMHVHVSQPDCPRLPAVDEDGRAPPSEQQPRRLSASTRALTSRSPRRR